MKYPPTAQSRGDRRSGFAFSFVLSLRPFQTRVLVLITPFVFATRNHRQTRRSSLSLFCPRDPGACAAGKSANWTCVGDTFQRFAASPISSKAAARCLPQARRSARLSPDNAFRRSAGASRKKCRILDAGEFVAVEDRVLPASTGGATAIVEWGLPHHPLFGGASPTLRVPA